jgi:O-antigen ligase
VAPEGFFEDYTKRLSSILGQEDAATGEIKHEDSAAGRTAMWKGVLVVLKNHPEYWLFGVGMNCYAQMYIQHIDEMAEVLTTAELAHVLFGGHGGKEIHNTYFSILIGGGFTVFFSWLFFLAYAWWQVHRIPKKYPRIIDGVDIHNYARAIEIGIMGYCLCIMFLNMEFIDMLYWHLTMTGVLVNIGKAKLQREELGQEDEEWYEEPVGSPVYAHSAH